MVWVWSLAHGCVAILAISTGHIHVAALSACVITYMYVWAFIHMLYEIRLVSYFLRVDWCKVTTVDMGDYKHWTRDLRTGNPRAGDPRAEDPGLAEDPESCAASCVALQKIYSGAINSMGSLLQAQTHSYVLYVYIVTIHFEGIIHTKPLFSDLFDAQSNLLPVLQICTHKVRKPAFPLTSQDYHVMAFDPRISCYNSLQHAIIRRVF